MFVCRASQPRHSGAAALRPSPESRNIRVHIWIPGSRASLAPRNDGENRRGAFDTFMECAGLIPEQRNAVKTKFLYCFRASRALWKTFLFSRNLKHLRHGRAKGAKRRLRA